MPVKLKAGTAIDIWDDNIPLWIRVAAFIETLTVKHGSLMGQPFKLQPFQIEVIKAVCDPNYDLCALTLPRGNGKSTLLAAIVVAAIVGPLAVPNTEIPVVASDKGQAGIVCEHVLMFLEEFRKADPQRFRVRDNKDDGIRIHDIINNIVVKAVSADPRSKHGAGFALSICDEPAQWLPNAGQKVWNAMTGSRGKQAHSRVVAIGTLPDSEHHFFSKAIASGLTDEGRAGGTWSMQFSAPPDADYDDTDAVAACNPMWHHIESLRKIILSEIQSIKIGEGSKNAFLAYRMNRGTMETDDVEYFLGPNTLEVWETCVMPKHELDQKHPRQGDFFLSFDLGEARSLTGAAISWPETGRYENYAAIPTHPEYTLEDKEREDGNPGVYTAAIKTGEMKTFANRITPIDQFLKWIANDILDGMTPKKIFADRYKQEQMMQSLMNLNNGWHRLIEFRAAGSGPDGKSDVTYTRKEIFAGDLHSAPSFLMVAALRDARIKRDENGNANLSKDRSRGRIDVLQAAVMAVGASYRAKYPDPNTQRAEGIDGYIVRF